MPLTIPLIAADGAKSTVTLPDPIVGASGPIIPASRITTWQPGVTYNGGIPNRTAIYKTLAPSGGDDRAAIQAALDSCPDNQVVRLTAGKFLLNSGPVYLTKSNITLRGAGPGTPGAVPAMHAVVAGTGGIGGTALVRPVSANDICLGLGYQNDSTIWNVGTTTRLTVNAVKGTNSCVVTSNARIAIGDIVLVDMIATNNPDFWKGARISANDGGSQWWFARVPNSVGQLMEVTGVNGNTITFATSFNLNYTTAYSASLTVYPAGYGVTKWSGVEDIYFTGGVGGGNVQMARAAYCWFKHVESDWGGSPSIGLSGSYRCEVRDSYIHGTPSPDPGGGGYLLSLNTYSSDNLIENNILWYGNKVIVMQRSGGGNVIAYNYMDDAFGSGYTDSPEAGLNAGHQYGPHMELLEGNYSHNFKGDDYWGASPYITIFRNHLSALRASHAPLNLTDIHGRMAVDVQAGSFYQNFVGNILGKQGQTLLGGQTSFVYENLNFPASDLVVLMWNFGAYQDINGNWKWDATTINTQLRQGNWDWVTQSQRWHGIGGAVGSGVPQTIPASMYLAAKPGFFGGKQWPWVDPATGTAYTLPAKARFDAGTPNSI